MSRLTFAIACLAAASTARAHEPAGAAPPPRPTVQIAILLDTSGSMNGLIAQAKTQLWGVVNEFVRARKDGQAPAVRVALYEYGKSTLPASGGFVRQILPLTDDLDRVSEELFALTTNGGEEYCGWAIREAVSNLGWSPDREVYKAIFIAGNEPFSQGPVDFRASCRESIARGIVVNTIFCGPTAVGASTGWDAGATLTDGRYLSIDQNRKVVEIATPQDVEIARLGIEVNKTYLPYGRMGMMGQARQAAQDVNAQEASPSALASRSYSKANAVYRNDAWDLVDAIKNGAAKLEEIKDDDLPADLRKLDQAARKARIEEASRQRGEIRARIVALSRDREAFLAAERTKQAPDKVDTLERAIVGAIRDQATRLRYQFE